MNVADRAQTFALRAHFGVANKHDGEPYVLHLQRVAIAVREQGYDKKAQAVAWLHDVVEDIDEVTLKTLSDAGFDDEIVNAVDALTKRKGESNENYYYRVRRNRLATIVKVCDLHDNFGRNYLIKDDATRLRMAHKYSMGISILT